MFASALPASLMIGIPLLILRRSFAVTIALAVAYVRGSFHGSCCGGDLYRGSPCPFVHHRVPVRARPLQVGACSRCRAGATGSLRGTLLNSPSLPVLIALVVSLAPNIPALSNLSARRSQSGLCADRAPKAFPENRVMFVHVLRNAPIPIITNR